MTWPGTEIKPKAIGPEPLSVAGTSTSKWPGTKIIRKPAPTPLVTPEQAGSIGQTATTRAVQTGEAYSVAHANETVKVVEPDAKAPAETIWETMFRPLKFAADSPITRERQDELGWEVQRTFRTGLPGSLAELEAYKKAHPAPEPRLSQDEQMRRYMKGEIPLPTEQSGAFTGVFNLISPQVRNIKQVLTATTPQEFAGYWSKRLDGFDPESPKEKALPGYDVNLAAWNWLKKYEQDKTTPLRNSMFPISKGFSDAARQARDWKEEAENIINPPTLPPTGEMSEKLMGMAATIGQFLFLRRYLPFSGPVADAWAAAEQTILSGGSPSEIAKSAAMMGAAGYILGPGMKNVPAIFRSLAVGGAFSVDAANQGGGWADIAINGAFPLLTHLPALQQKLYRAKFKHDFAVAGNDYEKVIKVVEDMVEVNKSFAEPAKPGAVSPEAKVSPAGEKPVQTPVGGSEVAPEPPEKVSSQFLESEYQAASKRQAKRGLTADDPTGEGGSLDLQAVKDWAVIGTYKAVKTTQDIFRALAGRTNKPVRAATEPIVLNEVRKRKLEIEKAFISSQHWKAEAATNKVNLDDIGALLEGDKARNLKTGETKADILKRATPEMLALRDKIAAAQEANRQAVNDYLKNLNQGEYIKHLEDYLPHFYTGSTRRIKNAVRDWANRNSPNAKQRKIPTLAEAADLGLEPITQNPADLHVMWSQINWQVATTRALLAQVKKLKDMNGDPLIVAGNKDHPSDWVLRDDPAIRTVFGTKAKDGTLILHQGGAWIHPDLWHSLRQVLERPMGGWFVRGLENFNSWAKGSMLSLSLFHHLALTEEAMGSMGPIRGLINTKGLSYKQGLARLEDPAFLEDAIMHGLSLGQTSDISIGKISEQLGKISKKMEGLGPLNVAKGVKWAWDTNSRILWDKYHRGLKAESYYRTVEKMMPDRPSGMSVDQLKDMAAKWVNDKFGGLEWEGQFWLSPKGRQVLHWMLLAPDWTLSTIRTALRPIFAGNKAMMKAGTRYWINEIIAIAGSTIAANYLISGKGPWENEEGHKMQVDVTPIVQYGLDQMARINGKERTDEEKAQRYYTHGAKRVNEIGHFVTNPIATLAQKASPAVRLVFEQVQGAQIGESGFPMEWNKDRDYKLGFWETVPMRAKQVLVNFLPLSAKGSNFMFATPLSKGATPYKTRVALIAQLRAYAEPGLLTDYKAGATFSDVTDVMKRTLAAAELNGVDAHKAFSQAMASAHQHYYGQLYAGLQEKDAKAVGEAAKSLVLLGATEGSVIRAGRSRAKKEDEMMDAVEAMDPFLDEYQGKALQHLKEVGLLIGE